MTGLYTYCHYKSNVVKKKGVQLYNTTFSSRDKRKAGSLILKGLKEIPITEFTPYTYDEICDIIENHWFIIYKKYIRMKHDLRLKGFILKNKNNKDPYE